jgi:hypothetical protein
VKIEFHERRRPSARGQLTASRVFVGCGAISSTRLMLDSIGRVPCTRRVQDSQYFVIPMLTRDLAPVRVATQGNTLAQVFLELEAGQVSEHSLHLQIYGYNDIMLAALSRRLPLPAANMESILRPLLGRLVVIQGFMHSVDSPGLTLHHETGRTHVVGDDTTAGALQVRRLMRHLGVHARKLGMAPIPWLAQLGRPGKSNHLGGQLPMRAQPGELETDVLGRIPSWERVHLIDSTVFPTVPATTITLSAMANAHRIATAAVSHDSSVVDRAACRDRGSL